MTDIINPFPEIENVTPIAIPFNEVPYLLTANLFALGQEEITLIDAGPLLPGVLDFIKDSFQREGLDFCKIKRVILTHGHMDHFGLAETLVKEIGHPVDVYIHPEDRWKISSEYLDNEIWYDELLLLQKLTDIPDEDFRIMAKGVRKYYSIATPIDDVKTMEDGDMFYGDGYSLQVVYTPGHSPGLCSLYEPDKNVLFCSDHIIKNITPKPILTLKRDTLIDKNFKSLEAYENSLKRVSELDVRYVFPGHGEWIEDMNPVINLYRKHYAQRKKLVWKAVNDKGLPLYHLVKDVFPNAEKGDLFIALSEIMSHLEVLLDVGLIEITDKGPPFIYRAVGKEADLLNL
jgi:glyoxylase-like metal-dependent hydrolase (beta-lactamase superfamily II)